MKNQKTFEVSELKTLGEAGSGQFEALVSVFDNVDHVNDRVLSSAFDRAVRDQQPPPVVWSHSWSIPPIGETLDWGPRDAGGKKGLGVKGALFVGADDKHMYADMAYAAMKSRDGRPPALREFSFSYDIPDGGQEKKSEDVAGKSVIVNELKELFPIHEVGPCLRGANALTEVIVPAKSLPEMTRLEALALAHGKTLTELLEEFEEFYAEKGKGAVITGAYPPGYAELLLFAEKAQPKEPE